MKVSYEDYSDNFEKIRKKKTESYIEKNKNYQKKKKTRKKSKYHLDDY